MVRLILKSFLVLLILCPSFTHGEGYSKRSPFSELRWNDAGAPEAKIVDIWYEVLAIDGAEISAILEFCRQQYSQRARKRFEEDLVQVLSEMGRPPAATVTLRVRNLGTHRVQTLPDVPMTEENRSALRAGRRQDSRPTTISAAQALADVADFQKQLESRFAYSDFNQVSIEDAVEDLRSRVTEPMSVDDLEAAIGQVVSLFIDGHARPGGYHPAFKDSRRLPFILEHTGSRFVAVRLDRTDFVEPAYPYVLSLDGLPVERWLAAHEPSVASGSPQLVLRRALRYLKNIDSARKILALPARDQLTLELVSEDGARRISSELTISETKPEVVDLPTRESGILEGNVGYLRLPSFSSRSGIHETIPGWMEEFRHTRGLIIDVRGNGGGSRQTLLELFPYFLRQGEAHIGNVCAYKLYESFKPDHLHSRFSYRQDHEGFSELEKNTIREFNSSFRPEVKIPPSGFSEWHYLVISKGQNDPRFYYSKPVILLTDPRCFSATDIFVGAFKGWRNVTVMGAATGGGSARSVVERLPNSGIRIQLASMVSFQPSGLLYDTRGVEVDIPVTPTPSSFLIDGEDNVLREATRLIDAIHGDQGPGASGDSP